ncbi:MAG: hypothetical protein LBP35_03565 [Candidatus Ancillula trichonymphae]|nr:hypothetical protein [Candidatus Ancillula trichonymphae]
MYAPEGCKVGGVIGHALSVQIGSANGSSPNFADSVIAGESGEEHTAVTGLTGVGGVIGLAGGVSALRGVAAHLPVHSTTTSIANQTVQTNAAGGIIGDIYMAAAGASCRVVAETENTLVQMARFLK